MSESNYTPESATKTHQDKLDSSIDYIADRVKKIERNFDVAVKPVRAKVLSRFPILFTLLTTFGVVAVFLGFERILSEIAFLNNRPWLILGIGILTLLMTGSLYKVLDKRSSIL